MKQIIMISLSLSVLTGRPELNRFAASKTGLPAGLSTYWLKKTKKELLRAHVTVSLRRALANSVQFISAGLPEKVFLF
ncbi:hypothetical protein BDD43_1510 [Mucilaginibacter gracilis]|uniref:Uncharacterized protein n=1 Tax=Mucilaginibacter gracilis TaxID=423350 RepID=A0A495IZC3_9SPHI|nr:hypothetical protein [Mucilaginibacter gracilis]RKR81364.1 hypothetical protein BDD43_1510 [Mucilaginibacter gracilis]